MRQGKVTSVHIDKAVNGFTVTVYGVGKARWSKAKTYVFLVLEDALRFIAHKLS